MRNRSILIADSGGTKTDWLWTDGREGQRKKRTCGLNPNQVDAASIRGVLDGEIKPWLNGRLPRQMRFFGAGLGTDLRQALMQTLLRETFPETEDIRTETDLVGAAYACLGKRPGVVGILGTGSVAFRYNGKTITERRGGLGYLLGDEGGGFSLGRAFLRAMLSDECPKDLEQAYLESTGLDRKTLMVELYSHPRPQQFLAGLVSFLARFRHELEVKTLLLKPLMYYVFEYLAPLVRDRKRIILMGGVTRALPELVADACLAGGVSKVVVLDQNPISALARFLLKEGAV